MNTFIQQGHIKLINLTVKAFIMLEIMLFFLLSIHQRMLKMYHSLFIPQINNQHSCFLP